MKIKSIVIRNFRGLANIETELGELVSVIVGPNAVGKTTFLEAIRLTRCLLAPRFQAEQGAGSAVSLVTNRRHLVVFNHGDN